MESDKKKIIKFFNLHGKLFITIVSKKIGLFLECRNLFKHTHNPTSSIERCFFCPLYTKGNYASFCNAVRFEKDQNLFSEVTPILYFCNYKIYK